MKKTNTSLVFLKYSLCLYNFIFLLSGCIVCGLGLWAVLDSWELISITPGHVYQATIWLTISTGFVSVLVALLGYTAIAFESRCLLAWFTILLVVIFIVESIIGLTSYVYQEQLELDLKENLLNKFVHPYSLYPDETAAVDQIQIKYECCGSDSYRDWTRPGAWQSEARGRVPAPLVPDSCCKSPAPGCGVRDHPSNIHYTGCRHRFFDELSMQLVWCSCLSVSIAVFQVCGIVITSCFFSALHKLDKYAPPILSSANGNSVVNHWNGN